MVEDIQRITKKEFKEHCSLHQYGNQLTGIKVLFFDWQEGETKEGKSFRGFSYALGAQGLSKVKLINLAYDDIFNDKPASLNHIYWAKRRVALLDEQRFKVPIAGIISFFK
jgi:hypothetical protein